MINNFTVSCREIIHGKSVRVSHFSTQADNCNCDFRLNIHYCKGEQIYRVATWIIIIYSFMVGCISMYLLYHQMFVVGRKIFLPSSKHRGILRPRPKEIFHVIVCTFTILQINHLGFKLFDGYTNTIWAELDLEISKLVPYALAILYPISLIYTTPTDDSIITPTRWSLNKNVIDTVGFSLMICPFISNVPIVVYTGYYADINEIEKATYFFRLHYLMWSIWIFIYLVSLIIFWYKLINNLTNLTTIINNRSNGEDKPILVKLKRFSKNLNIIVASFGSIFIIYSIATLVKAIGNRSLTIHNLGLNILSTLSLNYVPPIIFNIVQFIIIYQSRTRAMRSKVLSRSGSRDDTRLVRNYRNNVPMVYTSKHKLTSFKSSPGLHDHHDDEITIGTYVNDNIPNHCSPRFGFSYSTMTTLIGNHSNGSFYIDLPSPFERDEFNIPSPTIIQKFDGNGPRDCNKGSTNHNDDETDIPCYADRKEWLAEKPKRIPLKKDYMSYT